MGLIFGGELLVKCEVPNSQRQKLETIGILFDFSNSFEVEPRRHLGFNLSTTGRNQVG